MMGGLTFTPSGAGVAHSTEASGLTFTPSGAGVAHSTTPSHTETRGRKKGGTSSAVRDRALDCPALHSAQSVIRMAEAACDCGDGCADNLQIA